VNGDDVAVVATADSEFEAQTKAEVLRARGIEATVTYNAPSWTGQLPISPTSRGASVLVHREDLERALAALQGALEESVDIDWDEIDVGKREDDLPLHEVNRMPVPAMIAYAVAMGLLIITALVWLLGTFA
jgi:hypothetical protein